MKVPTIGESVTEVTLSEWLVKDGDFVNLDQPICEFESDKATLEFPAEAAGKLIHVAKEEDDLEIGALVARIDTSVAPPEGKSEATTAQEEASPAPSAAQSAPAPSASNSGAGIASPAAAKVLREASITPESVTGTGKDGRITKEDAVQAAKSKASQPAPAPPSPTPTPVASSQPTGERNERREKMSRMRRTIAKRLVSAKNNTAMLTTFNEVDLSNVIALRKKYQEKFVEKYGVKLGFMSLFARACANALMEFPAVNAQIDGDHIIYHDYVDVSVAISTPNGLVVPPIRNVESIGMHEFELQLKALAGKARNGTLSLEEMTGGTFTITNGGIFGSMMSTPIINEPQSAILGMHAIQQRPVAVNGQVEIRPMMYLAMSYDHRIIDGSTSVTFLVKVKEQLEDPMSMFMGLL